MSDQKRIAIGKVQDYHSSNEGLDQKDALIQCLDKGIISESDYDLLYTTIMEDKLYDSL